MGRRAVTVLAVRRCSMRSTCGQTVAISCGAVTEREQNVWRATPPQLWDEIWKGPVSEAEDVFNLAREEHSIRWQRIERMIQQGFGAFEGLRCIEIGAGAGTNAALMAKLSENSSK